VDQIPFVSAPAPEDFEGRKGIFSTVPTGPTAVAVPTAELAARLEAVCAQLTSAFAVVRPGSGEFGLESFEVLLDVSTAGEVRVVGSVGSQMQGGGLKLTFRRRTA